MEPRARVIIGCDLGERTTAVVAMGFALAEELGLPAVLLHAVARGGDAGEEARRRERVERELAGLVSAQAARWVPSSYLLGTGDAADELLLAAREDPGSLIVVGGPRRLVNEPHASRTALRVVRSAFGGVLTVNCRDDAVRITRILYATDLDGEHRAAEELTMKLVGAFDAKLIIAHVTHIGAESGHPEPLPAAERDRYHTPLVTQLVALRRRLDVERHARGATTPVAARFVVAPRVAEALLATAREEGADLVVVGTHGHGKLGRLVLGSVAESVLNGATVNVLTVRRAAR